MSVVVAEKLVLVLRGKFIKVFGNKTCRSCVEDKTLRLYLLVRMVFFGRHHAVILSHCYNAFFCMILEHKVKMTLSG